MSASFDSSWNIKSKRHILKPRRENFSNDKKILLLHSIVVRKATEFITSRRVFWKFQEDRIESLDLTEWDHFFVGKAIIYSPTPKIICYFYRLKNYSLNKIQNWLRIVFLPSKFHITLFFSFLNFLPPWLHSDQIGGPWGSRRWEDAWEQMGFQLHRF